MNRAVFLDRDNTLIHNDGDLGDPAQVQLIQGAASAVASLRGLGYRIVVVSNQGGVARGKYTEADVEATNNRLNQMIHETSGATIDRFYFCPFHPEGTVESYKREHPWRKPQPGMLLQAAKDLDLDMGQSWMVGDQLRDIEAGQAAGVRTILLTPEASGAQPPLLQDRVAHDLLSKSGTTPEVMPNFVARNLIEAVRIIAQQRRPEGVEDWRNLVEMSPAERTRPQPMPAAPTTSTPPAKPATPAPVVTPAPSSAPKPAPAPVPTPPAELPSLEAKPVPPAAPVVPATIVVPTTSAAPKPQTKSEPAPPRSGQLPSPPKTAPASERLPGAQTLAGIEQQLRQILQELRNHRRVGEEFNYLALLAIMFQLLAVICLLAGLWMGRTDPGLFLRWLGTAIMVQLITLTLVFFRKG